jgi:tetratricopeptide (TPR) repeat protein
LENPMTHSMILVALVAIASLAPLGCESLGPTSAQQDRVRTLTVSAQKSLLARQDGQSVDVMIARSRILDSEGRSDEAVRMLDVALSRRPTDALLVERARLTLHDEQAVGLLRQAISLCPTHPTAHLALGTRLGRMGQWDASVQELQRQVALNSTLAEGHLQLAISQSQTGDRRGALISLCIGMSQLDGPDRGPPSWTWSLMADLYDGTTRWPEAAARFRARAHSLEEGSPLPYPKLPAGDLPGLGLRPWDEAPALGVIFDVGGPEPLKLLAVSKHFTAGLAGIEAGDKVVRLDDRDVATFDDFLDWSDTTPTGAVARIEVERQGEKLVFTSQLMSGLEFESRWKQLFAEAEAAFDNKNYDEAWSLYADILVAMPVYNERLVTGCIQSAVLGHHESAAVDSAEGWLSVSPRDQHLLWLSAYAHASNAATLQGGDREQAYRQAIARIQSAQQLAPANGFLEAYLGVLENAAGLALHDRDETKATIDQPKRIRARLDRALALGDGGWAAEQLAANLDRRENTRRSERRAEIERNRRIFGQALFQAFAASAGGTGAGFGANPWRDSGLESQAIYGPSQPAFGPAYQIEQNMINSPLGY